MIFKKPGGNIKIRKIKNFINILEGCLPIKKFAWLPVELYDENFIWAYYRL